jgi:hypothetical protein
MRRDHRPHIHLAAEWLRMTAPLFRTKGVVKPARMVLLAFLAPVTETPRPA